MNDILVIIFYLICWSLTFELKIGLSRHFSGAIKVLRHLLERLVFGVDLAGAEVAAEQLEELWTAVTSLGLLEKLTMDRDHLRDLKDLGKLLSLKTLSLAYNKISFLPDDLNRIRGLRQLTLSGNHLKEVNQAVGDLEYLEKLDLKSTNVRSTAADRKKFGRKLTVRHRPASTHRLHCCLSPLLPASTAQPVLTP